MEDLNPQGLPTAGASHGHETNRIGLRGVVIFTIALFVTVGLAQALLSLVMTEFRETEKKSTASDYPVRKAIGIDQFPTPRLQQNPMSEMVELKKEEQGHVYSYGWVDKKAGIAHIPVDRALEILAKEGLPKVAAPAPVPGAPPNTSIPSATKRDEAGPEMSSPTPAKKDEPRPEARPGGKP